MTESVDHTVHHIIYLPPGFKVPPNALSQLGAIKRYQPSNRGMILVIGGGSLIRGLTQLATKIQPEIGAHVRFVQSLEEARSIIPS